MATDLEKITPPTYLSDAQKISVFNLFFRRLAQYRNTAVLYSTLESSGQGSLRFKEKQEAFETEINSWAQRVLQKAWIVCHGEDEEKCPNLDPFADTATGDLKELPTAESMGVILNTILFLEIVTFKQYSAHTRVFLSSLGQLDEETLANTLKNPKYVIEEAQKQADKTRTDHAEHGKSLRIIGVGLGAIAGGVLIGVTGGLAAPLVGAGVTTVLGWLGVGGSVLGLLASGLAGSSVVCGALFGAYGAQSTANMIERHTEVVRDLALVPVSSGLGYNTLGVRLCVSGWLSDENDVTAPWNTFTGDDTFALQWEIKALEELSDALMTLIKSHAMKYVQAEVLKRTVFASLMASLSPLALLKIGQIIDNPWMNARALAIKTGAVLGELLANRAFGNRPVTLIGYSLGSLVIFEALGYLALLEPSRSIHLIQDVFMFGTPVDAKTSTWTKIRRVVAGRVVNGHSQNDYVLGVLSRMSEATWEVAGLQQVDVKGVENICCEAVEGHMMWRTMIEEYVKEMTPHKK